MILELRINGELLLARKIDERVFSESELQTLESEIAYRVKKVWLEEDAAKGEA